MKELPLITLCVFAIALFVQEQIEAQSLYVTDLEAVRSCKLITFEGVENNASIPPIEGITAPNWLALIDEDAGGTGNFANEPSASTVAFWFDDVGSTERDILLDPPVNQLSLYYASSSSTTLTAYDGDGIVVATDSGPANIGAGAGGDPEGDFDQFDQLTVASLIGNPILRVVVSGQINETAIDNLEICTVDVTPPNQLPVAEAGSNYSGAEGASIMLDGGNSTDPDGEIASYMWDLDNDNEFDDAVGATPIVVFPDNGAFTVALQVTDSAEAIHTDTAIVTISNVSPTVDAGDDIGPVIVNDLIVFSQTTFTDPGSLDTHTATLNWGDGSALQSAVVNNNKVEANHQFLSAGNFLITVCVSDEDGGEGCDSAFIEVRQPELEFRLYLPILFTYALPPPQ